MDTLPKEITRESLEAALQQDKGREALLLDFDVQHFTTKGDNFATMVTCVKVRFSLKEEEHRVSYVVKYKPKRFKVFEDLTYVIYQKEAMFYTELLPEINTQLCEIDQKPLRVPNCYYTSLREGREVIFLEDLRPRGFQMFDRRKGMDVAHMKLLLEELARLHAASHLLKAKTTQDLSEKYPILNLDWLNYDENAWATTHEIFSNQMDMVAKMLQDIGGYKVAAAWLTKNKVRASEIFNIQLKRCPPFDMVCHGDCWSNNVLFRYDDENLPVEVMLLDLQHCRQASPTTDLSFLFHTSLEGHVRKPNVKKFLELYYSTLEQLMEASKTAMPFSLPEFQRDYTTHLEFGLLWTTLLNICVLGEGAFNEDEKDGFTDSMGDALSKIPQSPLLHSRLLCVFEEMIENGIITEGN